MNPALHSESRHADIKSEQLLALYRKMLLVRLCEERIRAEYSKDEMKTPVHLGIGGEAIAIGVTSSVPKGSKVFGTYRNHAIYLSLTDDIEGFFAEMYGKATGPGKGKAGSMHMTLPERGLIATSAVVGSTIPVAVGSAFASAYRKSSELSVSFFGDGAVEEGVFAESMNFAALRKLPILFICEDNDLAIHTVTTHRQGFRSIPELAGAYQCHVATAAGYDVGEVATQTRKMLAHMAEDPKPGFLRFEYFRYLEHVGPNEDFKAGYRTRPTAQNLQAWDPLQVTERRLHQGGVSEQELGAIRKSLQDRIDRSVLAAQQAPFADPSELYTDVLQ